MSDILQSHLVTTTSADTGGDVVGPASSTDNAVARFDGTTGKLLQNSVVLIDDSGNIDAVGDIALDTISADSTSGGVVIRSNDGTTVATFGAGGASSTTASFSGNVTFNGTTITANSITNNYAGGLVSTTADTVNKAAITAVQNDTTNNPAAFIITNTGTGNDITANNATLNNGVLKLGTPSASFAGDLVVRNDSASTSNYAATLVNQNTTNGNDVALAFGGLTTTSAATVFGSINTVMTSHANGSMDSSMRFRVQDNGTLTTRMEITQSDVAFTIGTSAGDDFTINTSGFVYEGDSGRVGIGTASPGSKLTIKSPGTDLNVLQILESSDDTNSLFAFVEDADGDSVFTMNDKDKNNVVRIAGGNGDTYFNFGNVGIGTSSPSTQFHIEETGNTLSQLLKTTDNNVVVLRGDANRTPTDVPVFALQGHWNGTAIADINFVTGDDTTNKDDGYIAMSTSQGGVSTQQMRIEQDGGIYFYNLLSAAASTDVNINGSNELHSVTSSKRFKENIVDSSLDTSNFSKIKVKEYDFKEEFGGDHEHGLIAEEFNKLYPEFVVKDKEGKPYSVQYSRLCLLLIKKVQELELQINS